MEGLSSRGASNISSFSKAPPKLLDPTDPNRENVIDLSDAENQVLRPEISELVKSSIADSFRAEDLQWPQGFYGDADLLELLANVFNAYFDPYKEILPHHVVVAPGAAECLDAIVYNICEPGDGVLVPQPYWNGYDYFFLVHSQVKAVGVAVDLQPSEDVELHVPLIDALEHAYQHASCPVKAVVLSNPQNPLGTCYSKRALEECLRFCQRYSIHLISDEVFALNAFEAPNNQNTQRFVSALSIDPEPLSCDESRVHVVWSLSKLLGVSGIRMGCVVTRKSQLRDGIALLGPQSVSTLSTVVARELLASQSLVHSLELNSKRLAKAYRTITVFFERLGVPYFPCNSTIVLMAKLTPHAQTWEDEANACRQYAQAGVLLTPGRTYRMPENHKGWMRILFAVDESTLITAIVRIERVYNQLQER